MRKTLLAASVLAAFSALPSVSFGQAAAAAPASPHTFTGNIGLFSEYRFRGIAQTFAKPALQGGFDYSHASGIYLGNWNSNTSSGAGFPASNLEMDFYGGWKGSWGDWGLDVGAIYYYYPGSDANVGNGTAGLFTNPTNGKTHSGRVDNSEFYIGGSWKFISLKYYHSLGDYFSLAGTKGSNYLDLSANYDLGGGWGINGHIGSFRLKSWHAGTDLTNGDYTDWKLGVTKDFSGWVVGVSYVDSSAKGSCNPANQGFYCFSNSAAGNVAGNGTAAAVGHQYKDAGKSTLVLSVSKSF